MLECRQIVRTHASLQPAREHLDTFVHSVAADGLRPQEFARIGREQELQRHSAGTWIIPRM